MTFEQWWEQNGTPSSDPIPAWALAFKEMVERAWVASELATTDRLTVTRIRELPVSDRSNRFATILKETF